MEDSYMPAMERKRAIENEVLGNLAYGAGRASETANRLAPPTQPVGGVDAALRRLQDRIARLDAVVEAAQQRFAPVVSAEPPSTVREGRNGGGTASMSPLGNSLEAFAGQVEAITDRLHSLVGRCEL